MPKITIDVGDSGGPNLCGNCPNIGSVRDAMSKKIVQRCEIFHVTLKCENQLYIRCDACMEAEDDYVECLQD
jgi:hypothetical protein